MVKSVHKTDWLVNTTWYSWISKLELAIWRFECYGDKQCLDKKRRKLADVVSDYYEKVWNTTLTWRRLKNHVLIVIKFCSILFERMQNRRLFWCVLTEHVLTNGSLFIKIISFFSGKLVDHKLVQLSLPLIYINAFFWSVTPHLGWAAYAIEPYGITCTLEWNAMPLSYLVSVFSVNYVIPAVTMAALFCSIMPSLCGSTVFTSPTYRHDMYLSRVRSYTAMYGCEMHALVNTIIATFHRSGKVVKVTALVFIADVEVCLQRLL